MQKHLLLVLSTLCLITSFAQAQQKKGMYPYDIDYSAAPPQFNKGKLILKTEKGISVESGLVTRVEKDNLGLTHHRLQQYINNIPVENAIYIQHTKDNRVISANGRWIKDLPARLDSRSSLSEQSALQLALSKVGASVYKWQVSEEENFIRLEKRDPQATFYPKGELVYYSGEDDIDPSNLRLAYKFDIYAEEPLSRQYVFVDAVNGAVLGTRDLIHTAERLPKRFSPAIGTAVTVYSGTLPINTDYNNGSYRLRESNGQGKVIETYNLRSGTSYTAAVDFTDADNTWNNVNKAKDQYATDAHWGAEKTYDFYKEKFGRNSIDGKGFPLKSYVHYSRNYFNAFWDGSRMTYGDGSSTDGFKPLTAIDVCGHEISHGLTSFTANLNYSYESGALNEGFSDVFGNTIEWYARPSKHSWLVGEDFHAIRDMSNPNRFSDPDTYKGTYWYAGSSDNGGVHTNSGVLNFWYYLLVQGGSGVNDKGTAYNVTGIGIDRAAAIAYRTLTVYLVPTSQYADAKTQSLKAAADLFNTGSDEVTQVNNAWIAVGLGTSTAAVTVADPGTSATSTSGLLGSPVFKVYPNPTRNQLSVELQGTGSKKERITITDLSGRLVYDRTYNVVEGQNLIKLQIPDKVVSGSYLVKAGTNSQIINVVKE